MAKFSAGLLETTVFRILRHVSLSTTQKKRNHLRSLAKSSPLLCVVFVLAAALAQASPVSVWLQDPKPGSNPNTVNVYATAYSSSGVTGWIIYVDDAVAYRADNIGSTLSHSIWLSNGRHLLYARAWTSDSFGTSSTEVVQVGPAPRSSSVLPTPPSDATVLSEIQNTSDNWKDCSLCAEGTHDTTNYWMAPYQNSPSMSGSSREFYADGLPWTNVLFIKTMPAYNSASHFLWDFWVYHDSKSAANIWSSEFDLWQILDGKEFMVGSQCDFGDGYWDTWDSANNRWVENGIACPRWAANTWHHIQWYVERVSPTQYRYDTLVVDGKGYGLNQTWGVNPTSWPDSVGIQWQLDESANGDPIHEWIDKVKLTLW